MTAFKDFPHSHFLPVTVWKRSLDLLHPWKAISLRWCNRMIYLVDCSAVSKAKSISYVDVAFATENNGIAIPKTNKSDWNGRKGVYRDWVSEQSCDRRGGAASSTTDRGWREQDQPPNPLRSSSYITNIFPCLPITHKHSLHIQWTWNATQSERWYSDASVSLVSAEANLITLLDLISRPLDNFLLPFAIVN